MNTINLIVGNDNGSNEFRIIVNDEMISQQNIVVKRKVLPETKIRDLDAHIKNIHNNLIGFVISPCVEPGLYAIGNSIKDSAVEKRGISLNIENKSNSDNVYITTLLSIAGYTLKHLYSSNGLEESTIIDVVVDMSISLPISSYTKSNRLLFSSNFSSSTHKVILLLGDKSQSFNIKFDFVKVIPEGVTAIHALKYIDYLVPGKTKEQFSDKIIQHVSIGDISSEYPTTYDIAFNPDELENSNNGIGHAITRALPRLMYKTNNKYLTRQEYSNILKDRLHKFHDEAYFEFEKELDYEANMIYDKTISILKKSNNVADILLVYGGGSILLKKYLKPKFQDYCNIIKTELIYFDDDITSVQLEAIGLNEFVKSDLFQILKNKYVHSSN